MSEFLKQFDPEVIELTQEFSTDMQQTLRDEQPRLLIVEGKAGYTQLSRIVRPDNGWQQLSDGTWELPERPENAANGRQPKETGSFTFTAQIPERGGHPDSFMRTLDLGKVVLNKVHTASPEFRESIVKETTILHIGGLLTNGKDVAITASASAKKERTIIPNKPGEKQIITVAELTEKTNPYVRTIEELAEWYDRIRVLVSEGQKLSRI